MSAPQNHPREVALAEVGWLAPSSGKERLSTMKQISLTLILLPLLLAGCARHYVMTLNNGARITAVGKPQLQGGAYVFKDVHGRQATLPAGRVSEIAPASMVKKESGVFVPKPSR